MQFSMSELIGSEELSQGLTHPLTLHSTMMMALSALGIV
jgi:hypothetical protein